MVIWLVIAPFFLSCGGGSVGLSVIAAIKACTVLLNSPIRASMELIWVSISDDPTGLSCDRFPCGYTCCFPYGCKPCAPRIKTCIRNFYHQINYTSLGNMVLTYSVFLWLISSSHWLDLALLPIPPLILTSPWPWIPLCLSTSLCTRSRAMILRCGNSATWPRPLYLPCILTPPLAFPPTWHWPLPLPSPPSSPSSPLLECFSLLGISSIKLVYLGKGCSWKHHA